MQRKVKNNGKFLFILGVILTAAFAVWTWLIQTIDVQPVGQNGTNIGFAAFNCRFHELTGVHMGLYAVTDLLGLVPFGICVLFGGIGLIQLFQRKSLFRVDRDILFLGIYYVVVIFGYLIFELIPVNYRPILIEGSMEASYPSSTTLLVLSVIPTLMFQTKRRLGDTVAGKVIGAVAAAFSGFMVIGRLLSGVHWFTDIAGGVLLSAGLFCIYKAAVLLWGTCEDE